MSQKQIVRLRWYKGKAGMAKVSFDEHGTPLNENNIVKLYHNTLEWKNYLTQCRRMGFVKLEVDSVYDHPYTEDNKAKTPQSIIDEVKDAFFGKEEVKELTPEQIEIAQLKAAVKALSEGKSEKPEIDPLLKEARQKYHDLFGKKGHHSWTVEEINKRIEDK